MVKQGHKYKGPGLLPWLALSSGEGEVLVATIDDRRPWALGEPRPMLTSFLTPLPMRYFHDQVPA